MQTDDLAPDRHGYCDTEQVGKRFGIAHQLAAEIMDLNDEGVDAERYVPGVGYVERVGHQHERWQFMRKWTEDNLIK